MAKLESKQNEYTQKGNSQDSLLVIYILQILKKYSSHEKPLSSQNVMEYLNNDYNIGNFDNEEALRKKVRRHLDTLAESYVCHCIKKKEGIRKNGYRWYYDASEDTYANYNGVAYETLSNEEINFLVDIITSSKIINTKSTSYIIKNLLKKSKLSKDEISARLRKIENEKWQKSINDDLSLMTEDIQSCIYNGYKIRFDYEDRKSILVSPHGWGSDENGKYTLIAKTEGDGEGEFSYFVLDKIENLEKTDLGYYFDDAYYDRYFGKADELSIESLFSNIKIINDAIKNKKGIEFEYLSYAIIDERVDVAGKEKRVLPHRLVFNDGKYYLIGYDEEEAKINYYRVDLISKLSYFNTKINISYYNERMMDGMEIAREIEKHPLMLAERDYIITFKVVESALDRVIDSFGKNAHDFEVLDETRNVGDSYERLVKFEVRTTKDEAFRWALANADVVELISPLDIRYKLRRITAPIHKTYAKTTQDKVQENIERVLATGTFKIDQRITEEIANETFKALDGNNDVTNEIKIYDVNADQTVYAGEFTATKWLDITKSQCIAPKWIAKLKEVVNIHISMTSISDVSWLSELKNLKVVRLEKSPISDLSMLRKHQNILFLELRDLNIRDISFIENQPRILNLRVLGCPIEDYSPLLKMNPLDYLEIDEKAVEALGMDNLIKHHPDAVIKVNQKVDNRKV